LLEHAVLPTLIPGMNETCASAVAVPKFRPKIVIVNAPLVGPFFGSIALISGPSYAKVAGTDEAF
jgi:hypothetical protein